jgi:hypothetical protein
LFVCLCWGISYPGYDSSPPSSSQIAELKFLPGSHS